MDLAQKKMLIGMLLTGTVMGGAGVVAMNVLPPALFPLPEGTELIDPLSGSLSDPVGGETTAESGDSEAQRPEQAPRATKRGLVDPILRRSMFDSSKIGLEATVEDDGEAGAKTALPLVLLATIVAEPAQFSSCLIAEEKSEDGASGYGIGDPVMDDATIHRIEQKRVVLKRSDGELEYLAMDDADFERPAKTGKAAKAGKKGKWDGVEKDGETKFTIDEETFNKILENPDKLASQIRAVPKTDEGGKVIGYRLSGIKRSSLFRKLGIKNGDVVHAVNGNELTSISSALAAFESLQSERSFKFDVTSRKKKQTYEYEVR